MSDSVDLWRLQGPRDCPAAATAQRTSLLKPSSTSFLDCPQNLFLIRFQCVSKIFYKLVSHPSLAAMHLHHTNMIEEPRQAMVLSRSRSKYSRLGMLRGSKYNGNGWTATSEDDSFFSDILSIETKYELEFVSCGLLCFKDPSSSGCPALLWNPLRGEALELPPSNVNALSCSAEGLQHKTRSRSISLL